MTLPEVSRAQWDAYQNGDPFPHIVLDDLFPGDVLEGVLAEFPRPGEVEWRRFDTPREKKLGMKTTHPIGDRARQFLYDLNSAPVLEFLEILTGIEGLIPDPYYIGGGLHQILPGGFLKIHADFNWHQKLKLHRRINLLIYLHKDWKDEYGGHLELWDKDMTACRKKVLPVFGRCVIFNTTDTAFHGHPEPLTCPEGMSRKSVALYYYYYYYYYSTTRPKEEMSAVRTTLFVKRHQEEWT